MTLPPFNPNAMCPKCGHNDINIRWHERTPFMVAVPAQEWLARQCLQCGYTWDEATMDSQPEDQS